MDKLLQQDVVIWRQMFYKMKFICGSSEKEFVRRNLTAIFTYELGSMCSWTGVKGKFKLSNTAMMECLRRATKACYPKITDRDYEVIVMKWFKYSNRRSMNTVK
ncbi:hypothetical protein JTB14_025839 [Gonioctena quinquepunctata]|nr:hypothetical protein JTB14_025839 [Gonioctena quinquepunctata]